jgi:uncharacterized protein
VADSLQLLLDVQDRDLVADQLRHRRATLPERVSLAEQEAAIARLDNELAGLGERLAEIQRSQRRLEDEIASLQEKGEAENRRLYSGTVTAPRELQALQEEVEALTRRQRALEDDLLDLMEAAEPLAEEVDRLEAQRDALDAEAAGLRVAIAEAESSIDAELIGVEEHRGEVAARVEPGLLATYEKLRQRLGGVGIARLEGTQCTGCHLSLHATELDAVRHSSGEGIVFHEECGRILVR